jgi:hypothetical protein
MAGKRLTSEQVIEHLTKCPADLCDLILELREFVLEVAPQVEEGIRFNALCYFKPNHPYGAIGGNVCMIGVRGDEVHLGFIHGAALPDPHGLLEGQAKAARHIPLRSSGDIRRSAFRKLIQAAVAHKPAAEC